MNKWVFHDWLSDDTWSVISFISAMTSGVWFQECEDLKYKVSPRSLFLYVLFFYFYRSPSYSLHCKLFPTDPSQEHYSTVNSSLDLFQSIARYTRRSLNKTRVSGYTGFPDSSPHWFHKFFTVPLGVPS